MDSGANDSLRRPRWRADVAPDRPALITATAIITGALVLFTMIAEDILDGGGLISRDDATLAWFIDHRTDALIRVARVLSTVGSFTTLLVLGVVLGLWLQRRRAHLLLAASPVVSLCVAGLASTIAKATFDRPRPPVEVHAAHVTLAAFPSGHATDAAAFFLAASGVIALTLATRTRSQVLALLAGAVAAGAIGISRLVLGVHWLSDVVAGWALGTATAVAVVTSTWWLSTRNDHRPATDNGAALPTHP